MILFSLIIHYIKMSFKIGYISAYFKIKNTIYIFACRLTFKVKNSIFRTNHYSYLSFLSIVQVATLSKFYPERQVKITSQKNQTKMIQIMCLFRKTVPFLKFRTQNFKHANDQFLSLSCRRPKGLKRKQIQA